MSSSPTYDVMAGLWKRWRKSTPIDSWHIAKHVDNIEDITVAGVELSFIDITTQIIIDNTELSIANERALFNRVADALGTAMENAIFRGVLFCRDMESVNPPSAPYHHDDVYTWEGLPVRIQMRPESYGMIYRFTLCLGVQL